MGQVRGRFAPSPSGEMHLGNAWTAFLVWLQVRQAGGTLVLRVEDLDPERSREEYAAQIMDDLTWLGLDWDEDGYFQSARGEYYAEALKTLETKGRIYPCFCSRADLRAAARAPHGLEGVLKYPGTCSNLSSGQQKEWAKSRRFSWRFRLPAEDLAFRDGIWGWQQRGEDHGDFIVQRSDGVYAYQLAVVVDDALMGINHVLRGADLLRATIYQVALYQDLGFPVPEFSHVPVILGPDGRRLSKRHGDVSLRALRRKGVLPEQIIGTFAFWAGIIDNPQAASAKDFIPLFNLKSIPRGAIVWDPEKW